MVGVHSKYLNYLKGVQADNQHFDHLRVAVIYSEHLRYLPGTTGNTRQMTFSYWTKRLRPGTYEYIITSFNGTNTDRIGFTSDNQFFIELKDGNSTEAEFHSDRVFRDPNAWYHFVVAFDTTAARVSSNEYFYTQSVIY